MTDLFSRIAKRALGLAPTIQPMVTPFYMPTQQQEGGDLLLDATLDEAHGDEMQQARTTTHQSVHEPERMQSRDKARSTSPVTRQPEYPQEPEYTHTPAHPPQPQSLHMSGHTTQPQHAPVSALPSHPEHVHRPEPLPEISLPYTSRRAEGTSGNGELERMRTVPLARDLEAAHIHSTHTFPAATPSTQLIQQGAMLSPVTDVVRDTTYGQRKPTREDIRGRNAISHSPKQVERHTGVILADVTQASPSVHVTIGRIEVRATLAPTTQAQTHRQHVAPKTMSLEEYLKQGGKGGRG